MGGSKTEWHDYIWKMRPNHLAVVLFIVATIPLFVPLGIPMGPSYLSSDFYRSIEIQAAKAKAEGRRPVWAKGYIVYAVSPGKKDLLATIMIHMMRLNYLFIFVIMDTTGQIDTEDLMVRYKFTEKLPKSDVIVGGPLKYGIDWVMTPFLPGEETAMARFSDDIWGACGGKDWYGTPFTELPMMQNLKTFANVDTTHLSAYSGTHIEMFIRQWTNARWPNIRAIATHAFEDLAYAYGKYVFGTISGTRGAAEYEYLVGFVGEDRSMIESRNTEGLVMFVAIALGAVHLNIQKRRRTAPTPKEEA